MKTNIRKLTLCALLGVSIGAHAAPVLIPNGDFSTPGGSGYSFFESSPGVVSFQTSGGSGDNGGYGLVNNTLGSWGGGLVSPPDFFYPGNTGIPLANLGLTAGQTYTFSMDMKNFIGTGTGGLKLEGWNTGFISGTGDVAASASSNQWATYSWNYTIPANATSIKIVPLLTGASGGSNADSVGFDNIKVNNTPVPPPPFVPLQIPNGGFEIPDGANWSYYTDGFGLTYPTTGGNPGGNAIIDGTLGGGYGVLVAFSNTEKTAASLGLTPGGPCTIQMDMKLISGTNVGGLKLEGPAGFVQIIEPAALAGLGVWATYTFEFTLQNGLNPVTQFKIVPLGKGGSKVAYDNIKIVLPAPPGPLQATITKGTSVSWTAASAVNQYQPQEGASISGPWTNLGSPLVGNTVSSVFDSSTSPFYQVLQSIPAVQQAAYNGNFALPGEISLDAEGWTPIGALPTRLESGGRGDNGACMQIKAVFVSMPPPNSEIQQNTKNILSNANGEIVPGNTYSFSLWAKQISSSGAYEQRYKISWLNDNGAIMGDGGFQNFPLPVTGNWVQFTQNGLIAPAGTTTAQIQILGVTGATAGDAGEVLIDDVSLQSTGFGTPSVISAATVPAVEISWESLTGMDYQVQSSGDLSTWSNFGGVIPGNGSIKAVYDTMASPSKFYKVGEF